MSIVDLYHELNIYSTWNVTISRIYENDTITITAPDCRYLFKISPYNQNPDIFYGVIYVRDTHVMLKNNLWYGGEGTTVEEVAQDIMSDMQTVMVDYDA